MVWEGSPVVPSSTAAVKIRAILSLLLTLKIWQQVCMKRISPLETCCHYILTQSTFLQAHAPSFTAGWHPFLSSLQVRRMWCCSCDRLPFLLREWLIVWFRFLMIGALLYTFSCFFMHKCVLFSHSLFNCGILAMGVFNSITLSSMAQLICDPAFLNAYRSKSFKWKNSEKIVFLEKCFLYIFCFRTFLQQWCLFDLFHKNYHKSENPGHIRPGPWKSCHPR